jgi:hypothetical protein
MDILYHYCSISNFVSILEHRSIWLSSLNLSNDTMEGRLVAEVIERLAMRDGLDGPTIAEFQTSLRIMEKELDGLGFCLSEDGDLLSQWRGYAADATGFSIGFSKEYLLLLRESISSQKQPVYTLHKVKYDAETQEELVRPTYTEVKKIIDSGRHKIPHPPTLLGQRTASDYEKELADFKKANFSIYLNLLMLLPELYALKTEAFREELEWRLITHLSREVDDPCSFRALPDRIVPYKSFDLAILSTEPIIEVKIGPKNLTPVHVVEGILKTYGFKNVIVNRSSATYR